MSRYIPYSLHWDNAPLDISFVFQKEKPAGNHGFLTVQEDKFVFEDGTVARFFGTLFNSGMNFCSHAHAKITAKRLAAFGVNLVRLHQMDADSACPNIFNFTRGSHENHTTEFDPESLDRLDYLQACLKEEGVGAVTYMPTRNTPAQLERRWGPQCPSDRPACRTPLLPLRPDHDRPAEEIQP